MTTGGSEHHIIPVSMVPTELLEEIRAHTKAANTAEVIRDAMFFVHKLMKLENAGNGSGFLMRRSHWRSPPCSPLAKRIRGETIEENS